MMLTHKVRKNISINEDMLHFLAPIIKEHNGNFSSSMREIIDFAIFSIDNCGSISRAKELIDTQNNCNDLRPNDRVIMQIIKVIKKKK